MGSEIFSCTFDYAGTEYACVHSAGQDSMIYDYKSGHISGKGYGDHENHDHSDGAGFGNGDGDGEGDDDGTGLRYNIYYPDFGTGDGFDNSTGNG